MHCLLLRRKKMDKSDYYYVGVDPHTEHVVFGFYQDKIQNSPIYLTPLEARQLIKLLETSIEILENVDESNKINDSDSYQ